MRLKLADRLALVAMLLAAIAAIAGLLVSGLYRDTAEGIRQARATDLVTLIGALPALAIGLWRARAGSVGGRLVAVAALGYLAYSYAIYAFSVVIDPLTPIHIAILGFATWSLVLTVFGLDDATLDLASRFRLPPRTTGAFLLTVAGLFGMVWLIRRDRRGSAGAAAGLAFLVILGLSVLAIFAFDAAAGIPVEYPPMVIFGAVTATAGVLLSVGLTNFAHETHNPAPGLRASSPA